jgi:hypothetical protein
VFLPRTNDFLYICSIWWEIYVPNKGFHVRLCSWGVDMLL